MQSTEFYHLFTQVLALTPTDDQQIAIQKLFPFLISKDQNEIFLLKGYAGTGKSTMISTLSKVLPSIKMKTVLLAPTGRAAKVISNYSGQNASTIHRKIYHKTMSPEGGMVFSLAQNMHKNTLFIVDEASMIAFGEKSEWSGGGSLLDDLLEYVFSGEDCKLLFCGDIAQLPPVGSAFSPALNAEFLQTRYSFKIIEVVLKNVVRQDKMSGILLNATKIRVNIASGQATFPEIETTKDVVAINGDELEDALNAAYREFGFEETLVITRSNKRANAYNAQIRNRIKWQENEISAGDQMMVVRNNYFWLEETSEAGFVANGDAIVVNKVIRTKELYGFNFAEVQIKLVDYPNIPETTVQLLMDTIYAEGPGLTQQQSQTLYENVMLDYQDVPSKGAKYKMLKENEFFNALHVKFSYAVTCHKAQGGQWPCVFIDLGYFTEEMLGEEFMRWLYTAFTRASQKVYLINFNEKFFSSLS